MKYEIFLNKVKTNLEKTDNYFSCEIDEILDVVKNSLSSEDIIDIKFPWRAQRCEQPPAFDPACEHCAQWHH